MVCCGVSSDAPKQIATIKNTNILNLMLHYFPSYANAFLIYSPALTVPLFNNYYYYNIVHLQTFPLCLVSNNFLSFFPSSVSLLTCVHLHL